jgi:propionate CoA-transferase
VIEQGAVGGMPLLGFAFGCAANAQAYVPSPAQFTYFQGGGFDRSMLSFLQVGADGSVNVSRLAAKPHVTAGAGGFVDITAKARRIVFSGTFMAGRMDAEAGDGHLAIRADAAIPKFVPEVEHVTFSGRMARERGQEVVYVTERCVLSLQEDGLTVTEVAPGVDLEKDVLGKVAIPLRVAPDLRPMDARLFRPEPMGLALPNRAPRRLERVAEVVASQSP